MRRASKTFARGSARYRVHVGPDDLGAFGRIGRVRPAPPPLEARRSVISLSSLERQPGGWDGATRWITVNVKRQKKEPQLLPLQSVHVWFRSKASMLLQGCFDFERQRFSGGFQ